MTAASFSIGMTIATSSAAICSIGISPSIRACLLTRRDPASAPGLHAIEVGERVERNRLNVPSQETLRFDYAETVHTFR
jgi:hypothetical protein